MTSRSILIAKYRTHNRRRLSDFQRNYAATFVRSPASPLNDAMRLNRRRFGAATSRKHNFLPRSTGDMRQARRITASELCKTRRSFPLAGSRSEERRDKDSWRRNALFQNYFTVILIRSDMTGGTCGTWVQSASTSCNVCVPGESVMVASVCPFPKWR